MTETTDFPLAVIGHVCAGPAELRARLVERGLDLTAIADLVQCRPLTLARATKTGASPRGVLVGLATLVTVIERLEARGVAIGQLARPIGSDPELDAAVAVVADESPLAERMIDRLRRVLAGGGRAGQLTIDALLTRAA